MEVDEGSAAALDATPANYSKEIAQELMAKLKETWNPRDPKASQHIRTEMATKCKGITANAAALGQLAGLGFTKRQLEKIFVAASE